VLIIEDEPSIRNILFVLLAGLGCDSDVACDGRQALAMLQKESFDAVLLDLRCSEPQPEKVVSKIKEINPNLVGRVLVITGEVTSPETLEIIERNCLPQLPQSRLIDELWIRLRSLLGFSRSPADSSS
jgi:two-component system response regulator MprA